jgi:hypothetical protein
MTLFGMSSPNVRKVVIALHEMALPYALEHVAVFKGQQFDLDVVAHNPPRYSRYRDRTLATSRNCWPSPPKVEASDRVPSKCSTSRGLTC